GSETHANKMYDIRFENLAIVYADVRFGIFVRNGAEVYNIDVVDVRVEQVNPELLYPHMKRRILRIVLEKNDNRRPGVIRDVYLKNFKSEDPGLMWSEIAARHADVKISNLVFEN